jgi:hypothetical protein
MDSNTNEEKVSFLERFSVDKAGNLFFDNYWIYIDGDYNLDFYQVNLDKSQTKLSEEITKKEEALQVRVIEKEIEEFKNKINDDENDYEYEENEVLHLQNYLYNPEYKYIKPFYKETLNEDEENETHNDESEDEEPYININGDFNLVRTDFDLSNYEVFMLDANKNLLSYTEIVNDDPLYRITLYENNKIELNIIGTKNILFSFEENKENINKPFILISKQISYQNLN